MISELEGHTAPGARRLGRDERRGERALEACLVFERRRKSASRHGDRLPPRYFKQGIAKDIEPDKQTLWWPRRIRLDGLGRALISLDGALADRRAWRKKLLLLYTFIGVGATALWSSVTPGQVFIGLALYALANAMYEGVYYYDALLPDLSALSSSGAGQATDGRGLHWEPRPPRAGPPLVSQESPPGSSFWSLLGGPCESGPGLHGP